MASQTPVNKAIETAMLNQIKRNYGPMRSAPLRTRKKMGLRSNYLTASRHYFGHLFGCVRINTEIGEYSLQLEMTALALVTAMGSCQPVWHFSCAASNTATATSATAKLSTSPEC